jgi:drug/metabolite transporter (DMT)-like permease
LGVVGGLGLDLSAKEILASYSLEQFVFLRSAIGVAIFLLLARQFGGVNKLKTLRWRWHLARTILAVGAMFGFFYGLARMPLVNALTLGFTAALDGRCHRICRRIDYSTTGHTANIAGA